MAAPEYDVFLSHAWADGERPKQLADALTKARPRVWFDAEEINDFDGITRAITEGLAKSKALLAYYSKTYPPRRACGWELTAVFLAAQTEGDPRRRQVRIFLRTEKSGQPVFLPIPCDMKAALDAVPVPRGCSGVSRYFFWSGNGTEKGMKSMVDRCLAAVFRKSGVRGAHFIGSGIRWQPSFSAV